VLTLTPELAYEYLPTNNQTILDLDIVLSEL
jgi:hypothetical protein